MRALRAFALAAAMVAIAGVAAAAPEEPRFVRAQPFVREHLETLEAAARVAAVSPAARPAVPAPCNATDSGDSVLFTWTDVAGETGYYVFRDGDLVMTLDANVTQYSDHATLGVHSYCIMAFNVDGVSDVCCDQGAQTEIPPPSPCGADPNSTLIFRWTGSPGAEGYLIDKDGTPFATASAAQTTLNLVTSPGTHTYCVKAFIGPSTSNPCCASITPHLPSVLARLSWGTCDPQVNNQNFTGPGVYTLVLSAIGSSNTNVGHDSELRIRPAVPDAWRFDEVGCQTGARLSFQVAGVDSCPPMRGTNWLAIKEYAIDLDGSAMLRLAVVYDDLTTIANQRYILWKIDFDHTHSIAGTDADPATCDGASVPLNFTVVPTILISGGLALTAAMEPNDLPTFWNGGQVPTKPMTWARVKALYR